MRSFVMPALAALTAGSVALGCSDSAPLDEPSASVEQAASTTSEVNGRVVFNAGIHGTPGNGRACATCHDGDDAFSLNPAAVERRFQALQTARLTDPNADDPLFRSIDANDGASDYTNLRNHALIRVVIKLPTDAQGNKLMWPVDDPNATEVSVWRGVPTVQNVAFTAPYQFDGRFPTLQVQAAGAFDAHSAITNVSSTILDDLANFQKTQFSSPRVAAFASALANNQPLPSAEPPLDALEQQGKAAFGQHCAQCHGGPTQTQLDPRMPDAAHDVFVSRPPPPFGDGLPWGPSPLAPRLWAFRVEGGDPEMRPSTDPGKALLTGSIAHMNHFDIPSLYGISKTAPYFHDNSSATLEDVVHHYQNGAAALRRVIPDFVPAPIRPDAIPESDVAPIVAYLKKI